MDNAQFDFEIHGRPKSIHSIWTKMRKKGVSFEEVYDLFAIRIIIIHRRNERKQIAGKYILLLQMNIHPHQKDCATG